MERKYLAAIAGFIGFVSGAISLVQFYSFTQIQKIKLEYDPSSNKNNLFEFIYDISDNVGNIVMLDFSMPIGKEIPDYEGDRYPFHRSLMDKKSVRWHFDGCSFTDEINRILKINRRCTTSFDKKENENFEEKWNETMRIFDKSLSIGRVSYEDLHIIDNGLTLILEGSGQNVNPFSIFEIENEGYDTAHGPFQVSSSNRDANIIIKISPAPYTKELPAQVKCAEKDWPYFVKFFVCPFL